jgi:hypothetical protein
MIRRLLTQFPITIPAPGPRTGVCDGPIGVDMAGGAGGGDPRPNHANREALRGHLFLGGRGCGKKARALLRRAHRRARRGRPHPLHRAHRLA